MNTWNLSCSQARDVVSRKIQILRDISTGKVRFTFIRHLRCQSKSFELLFKPSE